MVLEDFFPSSFLEPVLTVAVLSVQPAKLPVRIICNKIIHVEAINQIERNIMG